LNGTALSSYVNGVIAGSYSGMNVPANINRSACYIGYRPDTATDLSGYDEIKIYSRSLSAAEIFMDYSTPSFVTYDYSTIIYSNYTSYNGMAVITSITAINTLTGSNASSCMSACTANANCYLVVLVSNTTCYLYSSSALIQVIATVSTTVLYQKQISG
jgi:hypothetical protein